MFIEEEYQCHDKDIIRVLLSNDKDSFLLDAIIYLNERITEFTFTAQNLPSQKALDDFSHTQDMNKPFRHCRTHFENSVVSVILDITKTEDYCITIKVYSTEEIIIC